MNLRKIAAAAGFATGAALTFAPLASADTSANWLSAIDSLLTGGGPSAAGPSALDLQISFNGMDLFPVAGNEATATTLPGQFGLAIASGNGAHAIAEGGFGDSALASGTNALAYAGSTTAGAHNFNFDSATDIGNNADPHTYVGAPDGAYAGGGSLIGGVDSGTAGSSNDTAQFIGNGGVDNEVLNGGNSGAFAGDSALIGDGATAGNGDTAYTSGDILGFGDGSAAVAGSGDSAYTTGTETGTNEGAFSGFGNYNSATADTNYTTDGAGVSATDGNYNYALVDGTNNSTAAAGHGNNDLAEVLFTNGHASAQNGNFLYDIISPLGHAHSAAATAAADPAATDITSTVNSEVASLNALFTSDAALAGDYNFITHPTDPGIFSIVIPNDIGTVQDNGTTLFDYLVYGVNPSEAGLADDPGAYNVLNGALTEFDNAYNVELYSLLNGGDIAPATDVFSHADFLNDGVATAVSDYLQLGWSDLLGYFGVFTG
jgi:hypothetical protein